MGTAIRSFSLRIRGYSEQSEDDNLETDEELKNITGDLIDLTKTAKHTQGISVFKEGSTTEFKSILEYLGEVSDIWDEMTQKQQNAFLQKAFAKTQAQAGAAIIQNFDAVRKALEEMENAGGAADAEMTIIQESLDYKINNLRETWTGIFQNLIDRGTIGGIIDFLTTLSELIEKLTSNSTALSVAFSTVLASLTQFKFAKDFNWIDTFKSIGESVIEAGKGSVISPSLFSSIEIPDLDKLIESQELDNQINELEDKLDGFSERVSETMSEAFTEAFTDTDGIEEATEEYMATLNEKLEALREEQATDESSLVTLKEKQAALTEEIALEKGVREAVTEKEVVQNMSNQTLMESVMTERNLSIEEKELMMTEAKRLSVLAAENSEEAKAIIAKGQEATEEEQLRLAIIRETASRYALTDARMADVAVSIKQRMVRGEEVTQIEREIVATYEHIGALKQEEMQAGRTSKALTILKSVGSMLVTSAIIFGITKVIGLLDDWIHREEKLAEAAKKAKDQIDNVNKSLKETITTTNNIKKRYAELAQSVQNLGTAFQSQGTLSNDEYEEFLNLSNQLADLYPTLTQGYTKNGDALLKLSGKANTIVDSLDNLISRSEQLARIEIGEQMETVWEDSLIKIGHLQEEINGIVSTMTIDNGNTSVGQNQITKGAKTIEVITGGYKNELEAYQNLYEYINTHPTESLNKSILEDLSGNLTIDEVKNYIVEAVKTVNQDKANQLESIYGQNGFISLNELLTENELEKFSYELQKQVNIYQDKVTKVENDIAQINAEFSNNLSTYLGSSISFKQLDEIQQKIAYEMFNNFDITKIDTNEITSFNDLGDWYTNNIINQLSKIKNKEIQQELSNVLSGALTIGDLSQTYQDIIDYLTKPVDEGGLGLSKEKGGSGYKLVFELTTRLETISNKKHQVFEDIFGKLDETQFVPYREKYENFIDSLTNEELEKLSNIHIDFTGLLNAEDKIEYLKNLLIDIPDSKNIEIKATISDSIKQLATQVDPYFDEIGNFYQKIFEIVDDNEIQNDIFNPENFAKLDNDTLNSLRSTFEEISEEVGVAFDPSIVDDFWHKLENATNSEEAHEAIDSLVTQWLDATDTIKNINDDTANYIKVQLSNWGIINADEVVQSRLELNNAEAKAKEILPDIKKSYEEISVLQEGLNSANIAERESAKGKIALIQQEIEARIGQGNAAEIVKIKLFELQVAEAHLSLDNINSASDVAEILKIAQACGISANAIKSLQQYELAMAGANGMPSDVANMYLQQAKDALDPTQWLEDAKADWTEAAKDAGGSAGKEAVDAYQEQLDVLSWLYENDVIDTKHYLDQKGLLIRKMWENGTLDAKRYFELTHEWLREMLDLYNSAISYITKQLDKEIDRLEEERDKRIEAIEKERDAALEAIDEEIKAQETKIKLKEKEIKELQDANEERKREIDLQKKLYDLERNRNQRVNLVKNLCQAS